MDLKAMLADQMGHFTPYDIGTMLVSALAAATLAFVIGLLARAGSPGSREMAVWSAIVAVGVALVRASVPLSIALVAVAVLFRRDASRTAIGHPALLLAAIITGLGCGSSAAIIMAAATVPLGLILRWGLPAKA